MERLKGKHVWDKLIPLSKFYVGQKIYYLHTPKTYDLFGIVKKIEWKDNRIRDSLTRQKPDDVGPFYFVEWHKDKERKPWCLWYSESLLKGYL